MRRSFPPMPPDGPPPRRDPHSTVEGSNPHDMEAPIAGHYPPAPGDRFGGPEPHIGDVMTPPRDHRPMKGKFGGARCNCPQCKGR